MHALRVLFIFASHLLSLTLAIYSVRTSGVRVQVLLYAFIIDYLFRLGTIQVLHAEIKGRDRSWVGAMAPLISRPPKPHETSQPVREGDGGPPARLGIYVIVMVFLGALAFVLANVGPDKQLHIPAANAVADISWAMLIGLLYWVNSLLNRTIVINPATSFVDNLGYNTREVIVMTMAVLTGGLVVVYRQSAGLEPSAWTVMGPLLGFRFLFDLWASLNALPDPAVDP